MANLRLIAKAPEMKEQLVRCTMFLRGFEDCHHNGPLASDILVKADAILAEIEGAAS